MVNLGDQRPRVNKKKLRRQQKRAAGSKSADINNNSNSNGKQNHDVDEPTADCSQQDANRVTCSVCLVFGNTYLTYFS